MSETGYQMTNGSNTDKCSLVVKATTWHAENTGSSDVRLFVFFLVDLLYKTGAFFFNFSNK